MRDIKKTILTGVFSGAVLGGLFSCTETAEIPSLLMQDNPLSGQDDSGLNTYRYYFGEVEDKNKLYMREGMYDKDLGVACRWTFMLDTADPKTGLQLAENECTKSKLSEGWKMVLNQTPQHPNTFAVKSSDVSSDGSEIVQMSVSSSFDVAQVRTKLWDEKNHQVCLRSAAFDEKNNHRMLVAIDHGCFALSTKDFLIKRAIAVGPHTSV